MICTECQEEIPFWTEDVTVRVVFSDRRVERHCHHNPFNQADPHIIAILGSLECFDLYQMRDRARLN